MAPQVTVIIVNWNGRAHLERGLPALLAQRYASCDVVLLDNGSTDGSADLVERAFPQVKLIRLQENAGFVRANHIGMAASESDYVVTLNNDAVPEPHWLEALVDAAASDVTVAAVSSKMLFYGRPDLVDSAGISADIAGHAWDAGAGAPDAPEQREPVEVFGACAGAALYRRAALREATAMLGPGARGPFDEDFVMYAEDVDLAWRLRRLGYRSVLAPAARVLHVRGASARESMPIKTYYQVRNKLWTVFKNYPAAELVRWLPVVTAYDVLAMLRQLAVQGHAASLRGRIAAWAGWSRMRAKHAFVARGARVPFSAVGAHLEPLVSPWAMRRRFVQHREAYRAGGGGAG